MNNCPNCGEESTLYKGVRRCVWTVDGHTYSVSAEVEYYSCSFCRLLTLTEESANIVTKIINECLTYQGEAKPIPELIVE